MKVILSCFIFMMMMSLVSTVVTEVVDSSLVPTNDPNKITGCTTYYKYTSGGSSTYECKTCASSFGTGWDLTLATLANG